MALCAQCKTQETEMYENGVPICLACATDKAAKILRVERGVSNNGGGQPDPRIRPSHSKRD